jgi:hypothetical protein
MDPISLQQCTTLIIILIAIERIEILKSFKKILNPKLFRENLPGFFLLRICVEGYTKYRKHEANIQGGGKTVYIVFK